MVFTRNDDKDAFRHVMFTVLDFSAEDNDCPAPPNSEPVDLASPVVVTGGGGFVPVPPNIDVLDDPEDEITEVIGVAIKAGVDCVTPGKVPDTETAVETA